MPSLKDLRNRIASVKATQKITKAMQMVAAAKLRRAQTAAEEIQPLGADHAQAHLGTLALPFTRQHESVLEDVRIQAAREPAIGRDDDDADRARLARQEERMPVVRIRLGEMPDDVAYLGGIGARAAHALLRAAHLAGGHHLHGLGDLLSALHTRDLGADFLGAGHACAS